jgi:hypothetical protein
MALKVTTTTNSGVTTRVGTAPAINTAVKKVQFNLVNLEELNNIEADGLEDGYTLVYDAAQEKWVAQAVEGINVIDGGTF